MKTELLGEAQAELIRLMKRRGQIAVKEASHTLGLAPSTIRQHLMSLSNIGLIDNRSNRSGVGRPRKMYFLTDKADQFFESRDRFVLTRLLRFLVASGEDELLEQAFDEIHEEMTNRWQAQIAHLPINRRVDAVIQLLRDWGYAPAVDESNPGQIIIEFCHCPYASVVDIVDLPCQMEEKLLAQFTGGCPRRKKYIPDGDNCCCFVIDLTDDGPAS